MTLCGIAIPFKHVGGALNNVGCFFLSGLPGGLSYCMLVLVKEGAMSKLTEKRWNMRFQSWLRAPSMSMYLFACGQMARFRDQPLPYPHFVLAIVALLHFVNGVHYTSMAVETWARHDQMRVTENERSKSK